MNDIMEYKGYIGSVDYDAEDELFFGKVQGIRSLISYEGHNAASLRESFHEAVDDYLASCQQRCVD
jgi:predicted HicB family RNase H-like nuclease